MDRNQLDTRKALAFYGIKPQRGADKEFTFYRCPLHPESNPSLLVYPDGHWFCFGACAQGGTAIDFIMAYRKVSRKEALREAERIYGMQPQIQSAPWVFQQLEEPIS